MYKKYNLRIPDVKSGDKKSKDTKYSIKFSFIIYIGTGTIYINN